LQPARQKENWIRPINGEMEMARQNKKAVLTVSRGAATRSLRMNELGILSSKEARFMQGLVPTAPAIRVDTRYDNNTTGRTQASSMPVSALAPAAPVPVLPASALTLLQQPKRKPRLYLLRSSSSSPSSFELGLGITEIAGMAGSGKTQMALALCVQAASIAPDAPQQQQQQQQRQKALYLSLGEGTTQPKLAQRLGQMAGSSLDPLQHILTRIVHNQDDLLELLMGDLPTMLQQYNFRIVVLDSIAGMFRVPETSIAQRSETLFRVASILKKLSAQYNVPVVVVNQVTASFSAKNDAVLPALGLSWENCVNTSHLLARTETSRSITVRLSSDLLVGTTRRFAIHSSGPVEVLD